MSNEFFVEQLAEAEESYPKLKPTLTEAGYVLAGDLDVIDKTGKLWETYQIEIHYTDGFPYRFPLLYETGGKIPKIADWHVYEDTLTCCVKVLPAEIIRCLNGITITEYIREEALPYFFNQTHRRLEGFYVNGEYSHGLMGIYQFYEEALRTGKDVKKLLRLMHFIATNERPGRTSICFCGSGKKFRNCHRDTFDELRQLGSSVLLSDGLEIGKAFGIF
ncbi:MAG: SEC-C domain-containing protein [Flavipsychrobacter sp.]|nr:SEC-C domain-containing protein [Flavipsychrobacter sp.]